jgi:hypothetical protein
MGMLGGEDQPEEGMGGGDIKMMAMVGAFVGWQGVLLTIFLGALAGTAIFLPLTLIGRKKLVPFGVFLSVGAAAAWLVGPAIIMVPALPRILRGLGFAGLLLAAAACRGRAQDAAVDPIARLVDSLRPSVERATGLTFRRPPRFATRSRAQVRAYLVAKIAQELPPERLAAMGDAYRFSA